MTCLGRRSCLLVICIHDICIVVMVRKSTQHHANKAATHRAAALFNVTILHPGRLDERREPYGRRDPPRGAGARRVWPVLVGPTSPGSLCKPVQCLDASVRRPCILMPDSLASRSCSFVSWYAVRAAIVNVVHDQERKKPTWGNTRRCFTTSAYSSTSPPAWPSCSLSSLPTVSLENCEQVRRDSSNAIDCTTQRQKQ